MNLHEDELEHEPQRRHLDDPTYRPAIDAQHGAEEMVGRQGEGLTEIGVACLTALRRRGFDCSWRGNEGLFRNWRRG